MRSVLLAAVAASITGANAWGDASMPMDVRGNNYRAAVKGITYHGLGTKGSYQRVTSMDPQTGQCSQETHNFDSALGPFGDEISVHLRGPVNLKRFAAYAAAPPKKHKRGDDVNKHLKRHRRHAHEHAPHQNEKRGCGDWVTATWPSNGQLYSFQYEGPGCGPVPPPTPAPAPPVHQADAAAAAAAAAPAPAAASPSPPPSPASSSGFISGTWSRVGFYDAAAQKKEGLTFLNNKGDPTLSGGWTAAMGNSLSYADASGTKACKDSTILADTVIPSVEEVSIWTDSKCGDNGGDCGYYRPDTVAYHGFGGVQKAFVFEFTMPHGPNNGGPADDMGAIWFLNAQNPRTSQYGPPECKCWDACGEVDIFEILAPGEDRVTTAIHGSTGFQAGNVDYFQRPTDTPLILAAVFMDGKVHIQQLDSFDFAAGSGASMISDVTGSVNTVAKDISVANVY